VKWLKGLQPQDSARIDTLPIMYNHNVRYTSLDVKVPDHLLLSIKPTGPGYEDQSLHEKGLIGLHGWVADPERERALTGVIRLENNIGK